MPEVVGSSPTGSVIWEKEMNHIERIQIKNFQAHEELDIELGPGVITVVGPSDVGKSSVMRAVRWVARNSPSGTEFIRWGSKMASVKLTINGHTITRNRSKSANVYLVDDEKMVSFGTSVPGPVAEVLGLHDVNFQNQHDGPFWLGESAGEVARQLNDVVNLQIIDETLAKMGAMVRATIAEEGVVSQRVEEATIAMVAWESVPDMEKSFSVVSGMRDEYRLVVTRVEKLVELLETLCEEDLNASLFEEAHEEGQEVVQVAVAWAVTLDDIGGLTDVVASIEEVREVLSREVPDLSDVEKAAERWDCGRLSALRLDMTLESVCSSERDIRVVVQDLERATAALSEIQVDTECETCGQMIRN